MSFGRGKGKPVFREGGQRLPRKRKRIRSRRYEPCENDYKLVDLTAAYPWSVDLVWNVSIEIPGFWIHERHLATPR